MPINSNLNRVDVVKRDKDVVGRIKVSMAQNIYDADFEYGKQPLRWEEYTANGGTITHLPGVGGCALFLPANAPSAVTIRQSRPYHRYQPGKSMFLATAIQLGAANTNQVQRFGFFDEANGMFFEQSVANAGNPSGMYCVIRSDTNYAPISTGLSLQAVTTASAGVGATTLTVASATGIFVGQQVFGASGIPANTFVTAISGTTVTISSPTTTSMTSVEVTFQYLTTDVRFDYANWSDPQGVKAQIDWTKIQMFWLEYAWYGAGCLRWGVLINGEPFVLHEVGSGNNGSYGGGVLPGSGSGVVAWSRTGNLPVRYEQRNLGSVVSNTMYHYGVSVMLEGRNDDQRGFTYSYGMNPAAPRRYVAPNTTRYPVLSIQPRVMGVQEFGNTSSLAESTASITSTGSSYAGNTATLSSSITLPRITSFSVAGSVTTVQFRRAHGISTGTTITLAGFSPAGLNTTYTATYVSPSTISITNSTAATTIGTASASGVALVNNQLSGRYFYYQTTTGSFSMARIVGNTGNTFSYVDPIQGTQGATAMSVNGSITSITATANSTTLTFTGGSGNVFVGMTIALANGALPAGTTVVSLTSSTSGTMVVSSPATSSGTTTATLYPTFLIGQINRGQFLPKQLLVSSDSLCVVELIASTPGNPVTLTNAAFYPLALLGSPNSFATRDVSSTALSGGEVVSAFTAPAGGSGVITIDLTDFFPLYNNIVGNLPDILTVAISTKATQTPSPTVTFLNASGSVATMSFETDHDLNVGDSITLSGFSGGWNTTYTVSSVRDSHTITFASTASTPTVIGSVVFSKGANVGAHLICQEAMS